MKLILITLVACLAAVAQSEKIVGGYETTINAHPHQVSLKTSSHFCGGSILNANWIITAAHCIYGSTPTRISIVYGSTSRYETKNVVSVTKGIMHPNYNTRNLENDIALLKVNTMDLVNTPARAIALNTRYGKSDLIDTIKTCQVTGWGTLTSGGSILPTNLRAVDLPIVDIDRSQYKQSEIYESMMLAGDTYDGITQDSCQGDSGGPLIINADGTKYLAGLTSWGYGCGTTGVYTRVSSFISWIQSTMASN